ncbi:uncharacterized protein [Miscanthus floridulus]|uniref:uncharacterized protein n=1 Tax=Miscanthus floridulus TaxID=154761 RepID=UPI003459491D
MTSPMVATPVQLRTTGRLSFCCSFPRAPGTATTTRRRRFAAVRASAETMATEKLGIKVERNPPESRLSELGVRQWPKWGCEKSKFPWTYSAKETCYLLQGKVKVYPEGHGEEFVEITAGDLVVFPKGMKCTWDVAEAVDKHYNFE